MFEKLNSWYTIQRGGVYKIVFVNSVSDKGYNVKDKSGQIDFITFNDLANNIVEIVERKEKGILLD